MSISSTDTDGMQITPSSHIDNPFDRALENADNNPIQLQATYIAQRTTRNSQQMANILAPDFPGWALDPVLRNLDSAEQEPEVIDKRYCACIWARPPCLLKDLVQKIQREIRDVAPSLWYVPRSNLHMTVLDICSSLTEPEMEDRIAPLRRTITRIVNHSYTHRTRLLKPLINCDVSGIAVSFVPAAGEALHSDSPRSREEDKYTYHHLRRDIYQMAIETGAEIKPRYITPSAHITIARFMTNDQFLENPSPPDHRPESPRPDHKRVRALVEKIQQLNKWLEQEYWPRDNCIEVKKGGVWNVGEEVGLVFAKGLAWYGKGAEVMTGQGY